MAEIEEKKFEYFLKLLPNVRSKIIDEMETDDRCRFTRCSIQSDKEAKASKNFIYELKISRNISNVTIDVFYDRRNFVHNFYLTYVEIRGRKLKIYESYSENRRPRWEEELDVSTNLEEYAIEDFKKRLGIFQKTIKKLAIHDQVDPTRPNLLKNIAAGIESLNSLETLKIYSDIDIQQIFSKLRRPLNKLTVWSSGTNVNFEECEQVYQVREKLELRDGNFNIAQLIKLSSNHIQIPFGKLSERDIFTLIRSWQNGTIWKENQFYLWRWGSNFNRHKLLRFLRSELSEPESLMPSIEIKHFNKPEKSAKLTFLRDNLFFETR